MHWLETHKTGIPIAIDLWRPRPVGGSRARLPDNVAKFIGDKVEPQITVGQQGYTGDGKPILFLRNQGIEIDSQYSERVFDPHIEGSGVRLAIVPHILHHHDMHVWVESRVDQGTAFFFPPVNFMRSIRCCTKIMLSFVEYSRE